nr:Dihydrofolate reductase [uncultured bacterium]
MVVAYDRHRAIGKAGGRPWEGGKLRADMKRFRELTRGKTVIMGRRTFQTDVGGRALPKRQNIVLSREEFAAPEVETAHTLAEAYRLAKGDIVVIGGGQIYKEALPDIDTIYATEIDGDIEGDAFFPELADDEWRETSREMFAPDEDNMYGYSFVTFKRIK